ncbi:E3 ubiquitin-protein ligase SIRP1-like [Impatiens glandulifera]|uniref:E3 ubiquitin-protein ligase SIRP1-like n=1 Tax=Impatiens glandulifera TaxID=253017 RepID=UPI001FB0C33B|nr:E3 ubiquitin-protein ligase SIRP1-like [Impatiens glandulifera]
MDGGVGVNRYWCYNCEHVINPIRIGAEMVQCPLCQGGFVEDIASSGVVDSSSSSSREEDFSDFLGTAGSGGSESDRALSLWAPILLGMMSNPRRRRRLRRRLELADEEDDENNNNNQSHHEVESIDPRRRRRSSATILQLLQGIRAGMLSEADNNRRRESSDRENSILINPFDHSIILNGPSFGSENRNHNHRIGSLGDYFVGPGLDLLLQHLAENDPNRYGTPPAQKAVVETMPSVRINDNLSQCSVCLDDFEVGKEAKEMPCKHKFHSGCILPWLELHSSCPVCRYQLPLDEPKVDNNDIMAAAAVDVNGGVDDGNRRRFSMPIPWPLSSLFSSPSSSSLGSTSRTDENNNNNNNNEN